jgi:hypothetical protein
MNYDEQKMQINFWGVYYELCPGNRFYVQLIDSDLSLRSRVVGF